MEGSGIRVFVPLDTGRVLSILDIISIRFIRVNNYQIWMMTLAQL